MCVSMCRCIAPTHIYLWDTHGLGCTSRSHHSKSNVLTLFIIYSKYRTLNSNVLSFEGKGREREVAWSLCKRGLFQSFLFPRSQAQLIITAIMLIGNCPWPRPVKHFGTLSLRSHDRSFPTVAFRLTYRPIDLPIVDPRVCLPPRGIAMKTGTPFASRFFDAAKLFRTSITLAETTANDRPRS